MSLIDATYFIGELSIANIDQPQVLSRVNGFITKYQAKFLKELMGATLYADYLAGVAMNPVPAKWTTLNGKIADTVSKTSALTNYVWYWYMRDNTSLTASMGQVKASNENSSPVSVVDKMVRAWNEMVQMVYEIAQFIYDHPTDYGVYPFGSWTYNAPPVFVYHIDGNRVFLPDIFRVQNTLNI